MTPQELELTRGRLLRVWWAHVWRSLLAVVASLLTGMVVGGVIGAILGLSMSMAGYGVDEIQAVAKPVGFVLGAAIGLAFSIIPMKLIIGRSFGDFRLVLVPNTTEPQPETEGAA